MKTIADLVKRLDEVKKAELIYQDLYFKATATRKSLEAALTSQYQIAATDTANVRRHIISVMQQKPDRLWGLGEIAQELPQYSSDLLSRQLKQLSKRSIIIWSGRTGAGSKYLLNHYIGRAV